MSLTISSPRSTCGRARSPRPSRSCAAGQADAQTLHDADSSRQGAVKNHDGDRTRTASGPSALKPMHPADNKWWHDEDWKNKSKNFPNKEKKTKTDQAMNNDIQLEDRVSRSRSKHEGESSASLCDRLSRIREVSQRQLPTDHDYAVPTREYQLDQSSPLPATAAADPVLERTNAKTTPTIRRC